MVEFADLPGPIAAGGLKAALDGRFHIASLRHFAMNGAFAAAVRTEVGVAMPETARFALAAVGDHRLIRRKPGESWLLSRSPEPIRRLQSAAAALEDGCIVDLTGGICVVRVEGADAGALLARLGGQDVIPDFGESCSGRLAELAVTAVRVRPSEIWLLVDRAYTPHLMDWIRISAGDI